MKVNHIFVNVLDLPVFPESLSAACKEFLDRTLQVDPLNRSTVDELLQLPFVKGKPFFQQKERTGF